MIQLQNSRRQRPALVFALIAAGAFSVGCDRSSDVAAPESPVEPAEAEFERVTQRLESALADAQAAAGFGVASKRECSYQLIPPANDKDEYQAEVTIETTTRLVKPKLPVRQQPKPNADTPEEIAAAAQQQAAENPAEPTPREVAEQDAAKIAEASETRRRETYRLAYKNNRWRMDELPEEPIERIIFEYALNY